MMKTIISKHCFTLFFTLLSARSFPTRAHDLDLRSRVIKRYGGNSPTIDWSEPQKLHIDIRGGNSDDPYHSRRDDDSHYEGNNQGDYYDDDRYRNRDDRDKSYNRMNSVSNDITKMIKKGDKRIGISLLGAGLIFTVFGVALFFNKSLMRIGNLLFIAGVPMTIGPGRTAGYFFQPKKSRATACLALGILIVFLGSPVIGILFEIFGFLNLFGNLFPLVKMMLKTLPGVGSLFKNDNKSSRSKNKDSYNEERDYDRDYKDRDYDRDYKESHSEDYRSDNRGYGEGEEDRYYRDRDDNYY